MQLQSIKAVYSTHQTQPSTWHVSWPCHVWNNAMQGKHCHSLLNAIKGLMGRSEITVQSRHTHCIHFCSSTNLFVHITSAVEVYVRINNKTNKEPSIGMLPYIKKSLKMKNIKWLSHCTHKIQNKARDRHDIKYWHYWLCFWCTEV